MNNKLTFIQFLKEAPTQAQDQNNSTSVVDMDSQELRRLSTMDANNRSSEMARRRRAEQSSTSSPILKSLLKQKEMIEQKIAIEKTRLNQQGKGS